MIEHNFTCPHCRETIWVLLDTSVNNQTYIEDCEVCCNPIQLVIHFIDLEFTGFQANSIEQ